MANLDSRDLGGVMELHIAVDMDDVVVDFWPRVIQCYNTEFGTSYDAALTASWDKNVIKESRYFGVAGLYQDWMEWWRDRHWLWASCQAIPGALGGLAELRQQGHTIELLTHKPEWARRETTAWLAKWHPPFDRLTFVPPGERKVEHSDADVLVDDKPENVEQWLEDCRPAVLFNQPWNQQWTPGVRPVFRANDWSVVVERVALLAANWRVAF